MASGVQLDFPFPSLEFPGRTVLYPHEVAERLGCSIDQIYDLCDEKALGAVNIASTGASRRELRIPMEAWLRFIVARSNDATAGGHSETALYQLASAAIAQIQNPTLLGDLARRAAQRAKA